MLGEVEKKRAITRSGARPGDLLFVTGTLGDSAAGLELLKARVKGQGARGKGDANKLIQKHLIPMPRIAEGRRLSGFASAMIDVSDGLSSDLGHLCAQSGAGAEVFIDQLPLSKELRTARTLKQPSEEYALSGGEDYELLFTVPPAKIKKLDAKEIAATEIGVITRDRSMRLIDKHGKSTPLSATGYDHFRSGRRSGSIR